MRLSVEIPTFQFHTHTRRCKHAGGSDRAFVEAAVAAGFTRLGFSDHCPWPASGSFVSSMRMHESEIGDYVRSLLALREEYAGRCKIEIGFECEWIPERAEAQQELFAPYPIDFLILGQHFVGCEEEGRWSGFPTDDECVLGRYVDLCLEGLSTQRYRYLAHPDLLRFTGSEAAYRRQMSRLCAGMKAGNFPVEINRLGVVEGRHYPSRRFLELAAEYELRSILGVDAHQPAHFSDRAGLERCIKLAEQYHLTPWAER